MVVLDREHGGLGLPALLPSYLGELLSYVIRKFDSIFAIRSLLLGKLLAEGKLLGMLSILHGDPAEGHRDWLGKRIGLFIAFTHVGERHMGDEGELVRHRNVPPLEVVDEILLEVVDRMRT